MSVGDRESIELNGVATNNLKAVDVRFPIGELTVVTGVSGSGKSSLVFDTLYAEAYRRYVESLSSFARQFMKALPKPEIAHVRNLPPAIAVRQTQATANSRSTVGTATELSDVMRILYAHLSEVQCTQCGGPVRKEHAEGVAAQTLAAQAGSRLLICAPLDRWGKVAAKELKSQLEAQGFSRLLDAAGQLLKLPEAKAADLKGAYVVVDRLTVGEESRTRLPESLQLAFRVGRGKLWLVPEAAGVPDLAGRHAYSTGLDCPRCGLEYTEPGVALLSFNHPMGACSVCQGFGYEADLDWEKVLPSRSASLADRGVAPWNFGKFAEYYTWAETSAKTVGVAFDKPFSAYTPDEWTWLSHGEGRKFDGILGFFTYLESKKYKAHYRIHAARYRRYVVCTACHGDRLNAQALACKLEGLNLAEASRLRIGQLATWFDAVSRRAAGGAGTAAPGLMGVGEALEEGRARLSYLARIGVGYLDLARASRTLSGGELQRINMARCLGSALTATLFCLDEPSAGLHARDSANLLGVIRELRDQGNTVVMVEHERRLIDGADHLLEIGPEAGAGGGYVVYAGPPRPAAPLSGAVPGERGFAARHAAGKARFIELKGARTHNLQGIDVRFPVQAISAVCGVSGSGKTSLVQHTLYPLLARALGQAEGRAGAAEPVAAGVGPPALIQAHGEVTLVSQAGLGRSSRSNIATYLGMMDDIRKQLAAQPLAAKLGLTAGSFSFNNSKERGGGRCETCRGLGTVTEDLSFLGEMEVLCPACAGRRFEDRVLEVELLGRNLIAILRLTVAEARSVFFDRPQLVKACDLVIGMGMGYVTLGQATSSFSGGEAQRLKLLSLMRDVKDVKQAKPALLILDEPTTGLADSDVENLLRQLRTLTAMGHTIVIVEHHLDVLRGADWLIEIGPEAAEGGGRLIYQGPPAGLSAVAESVTRPYLWGASGSAGVPPPPGVSGRGLPQSLNPLELKDF